MPISDRLKPHIDFLADSLMPGPYECLFCEEEENVGEDGLCDACREKLRYMPNPIYLQPLDGITVGLRYTEEVAACVMRFKRYEQTEYAGFFTQFLSVPEEWHADLLVPVPMHPVKRHIRGFNHSEVLCAYLSHATGIPYTNELLFKTKLTFEQKKLTQAERRRNIRGSFEANSLVKGLSIVIVDDVFTTGATVYECAKVLKRSGAAKVYLAAVTSPDR
ncbi:MAG: ComF family protein [Clostridia bacterium]|nr:ComF family protein [Clostridia bacterium]